MGLFYTNITLDGAEQKEIADYLNRLKRVAYVSPTVEKFTVVYDQETEDQNTEVIESLAASLTKRFQCQALAALVHDSDVFLYWLYNHGECLDRYNSLPGYFDSTVGMLPPEGGDPDALCQAFEKASAIDKVQHIFELAEEGSHDDGRSGINLQGEDLHQALVEALGMPSFAANAGYYRIENTDQPKELVRTSLIKCSA